jgi:hypothetical protein
MYIDGNINSEKFISNKPNKSFKNGDYRDDDEMLKQDCSKDTREDSPRLINLGQTLTNSIRRTSIKNKDRRNSAKTISVRAIPQENNDQVEVPAPLNKHRSLTSFIGGKLNLSTHPQKKEEEFVPPGSAPDSRATPRAPGSSFFGGSALKMPWINGGINKAHGNNRGPIVRRSSITKTVEVQDAKAQVYIYVYIYIFIHIYIYMYICIYICIYTYI